MITRQTVMLQTANDGNYLSHLISVAFLYLRRCYLFVIFADLVNNGNEMYSMTASL